MQTLYYNGEIITMDSKYGIAEAVLIENKTIIAVDKLKNILRKVNKDVIKYDLQGKALLPGFIDAHSHVSMVAASFNFINLAPAPFGICNNITDIKVTLKKEIEKNKTKYNKDNWLIGINYDNKGFGQDIFLTKFDLDKVSLDIPIYVAHFSYHSGVANSKLLEILNINENTLDPECGNYVRIKDSKEPNGIIQERAVSGNKLISDQLLLTKYKTQWSSLWKKTWKYFASSGYTTIQDGLQNICNIPQMFCTIKKNFKKGEINLYIFVMFEMVIYFVMLNDSVESCNSNNIDLRSVGVRFDLIFYP